MEMNPPAIERIPEWTHEDREASIMFLKYMMAMEYRLDTEWWQRVAYLRKIAKRFDAIHQR
jgi:hypothetical protein